MKIDKNLLIPAMMIMNNAGVAVDDTFKYVRPTYDVYKKTMTDDGVTTVEIEHNPVVDCEVAYP